MDIVGFRYYVDPVARSGPTDATIDPVAGTFGNGAGLTTFPRAQAAELVAAARSLVNQVTSDHTVEPFEDLYDAVTGAMIAHCGTHVIAGTPPVVDQVSIGLPLGTLQPVSKVLDFCLGVERAVLGLPPAP